jgi:hypothetical protein
LVAGFFNVFGWDASNVVIFDSIQWYGALRFKEVIGGIHRTLSNRNIPDEDLDTYEWNEKSRVRGSG